MRCDSCQCFGVHCAPAAHEKALRWSSSQLDASFYDKKQQRMKFQLKNDGDEILLQGDMLADSKNLKCTTCVLEPDCYRLLDTVNRHELVVDVKTMFKLNSVESRHSFGYSENQIL